MPEEIHEHYDPAGELVGTTRIIRESAWDDDQRADAEALYEAEALICPRCGNPREVCSNPDIPWYPQRAICHASAALEVVEWKWREKYKDAKRTDRYPGLPTDGVHVWVSAHDLSPDDNFV